MTAETTPTARLREQIGRVKAALLKEESHRAETLFYAANGLCIAAETYLRAADALPASAAPAYSLESLARTCGWGELTAEAAFNFAYERERLLRIAQQLLETHKSDAATAELAIRDRVERLRAVSAVPSAAPQEPT